MKNASKKVFDVVLAGVFILMASALYAGIAILILLDSGPPVIFRQQRVGLHGKPFSIWKFRTMVPNAASIGPYYTAANDPRITRVGRVLRKTSLDELPQLFNVLKGDMSLVGPRPNVEKQREEYRAEDWDLRNSVLPGITGLAQVSGRSRCTFEERLGYDLKYVRTHNLLLDIKLLFLTVAGVISRKGSF